MEIWKFIRWGGFAKISKGPWWLNRQQMTSNFHSSKETEPTSRCLLLHLMAFFTACQPTCLFIGITHSWFGCLCLRFVSTSTSGTLWSNNFSLNDLDARRRKVLQLARLLSQRPLLMSRIHLQVDVNYPRSEIKQLSQRTNFQHQNFSVNAIVQDPTKGTRCPLTDTNSICISPTRLIISFLDWITGPGLVMVIGSLPLEKFLTMIDA